MRIVYVLTSLGVGGAERQVLTLAKRMAERGHAVALLVLRPGLKEEWPTSLDAVHLDMHRSALSFARGVLRARRFLRDFRPDVVHSHSFHANFTARLLRALAPAHAVVSTIHNVNEGGHARMLAYRLTDFLSRRTTAVSQAVADRFVQLKAVPRGKIVVVTNGIDTAEFSINADRRSEMRTTMGVSEEFVWLAAGRIVPAKDFPNLLRAFARVRAAWPQAQLWIAGEGNPGGVKEVSLFAVEKGLVQQARWLGLRRDMPALLDAADGFVLSSSWEGMPLVVGEAMAMEKPVVATDVGGVRELVGDAGMIVQAGNSEALAEAMLAAMRRSTEDRQRLGRETRARIESSFGMDARAAEWESLYRRVLASDDAAHP